MIWLRRLKHRGKTTKNAIQHASTNCDGIKERRARAKDTNWRIQSQVNAFFSVKNGMKKKKKLCETNPVWMCFSHRSLPCDSYFILFFFHYWKENILFYARRATHRAKPFLIFSFAQWNDKTEWIKLTGTFIRTGEVVPVLCVCWLLCAKFSIQDVIVFVNEI